MAVIRANTSGGGGLQGIHDHYDTYSSASQNSIVYDLNFDPTMIFVKGGSYNSGSWKWWSSSWIKNDANVITHDYKTSSNTYGAYTYTLPNTTAAPAIRVVNGRHIEITASLNNVVANDVDIWIM